MTLAPVPSLFDSTAEIDAEAPTAADVMILEREGQLIRVRLLLRRAHQVLTLGLFCNQPRRQSIAAP